ncbi:MAG TPA: response regulator [Candidatus Limnocylindrales bacterium]|nr:response regulator [Candidatus Limnocylindrales bacterium]
MKELPKVYFERLLETSPDIVVAVDKNGTIIFYNDGAEETLGYEAEEVLGTPVVRLYPTANEARRVMSSMRAGKGHVSTFETEFISKDGRAVPVAISGSIIHDEKGREQGSIGFAKDIGKLRKHDQLATLGQLAVTLAHEINNPLEVLVNQVELLERYLKQKASEEDYTREHDRIAAIKRELRRIQTIVERVGEMAAEGNYQTSEYMPGRLMTDLGLENEPGPPPPPPPPAPPECHLRGKSVLVVDDNEEVRTSMADILGGEGCQVFTTGSGVEALKVLDEKPVDLVISDVQMPDMDGYELFRQIRADHSELPVVLMTAYYYDKDHVIKRSKAEGLRDVIFKKPIDPSRLRELVEARAGG